MWRRNSTFGLLAAGLVMLFSPLARAETIALWLCDEGGGKTLKDSSGNGHHGTIEGDVGWVEGKYGMALELGGEPDMALVPGSPDLTGPTAMTKWKTRQHKCQARRGFLHSSTNMVH